MSLRVRPRCCRIAFLARDFIGDVPAALTPPTLFAESEPRDAGTDQRSSGIIRLHTIKQIIDRVSRADSLRRKASEASQMV